MPNYTCAKCGIIFYRRVGRKLSTTCCGRECRAAYQRIGNINVGGYKRYGINGKQVLEHRLVVEQAIGRKLLPSEIVHHINGKRTDNRLSNLEILSNAEHTRQHRPLTWDIEAAKSLREKGLSFRKIGKEVGTDHSAVRQALRNRGIS